MRLQTDYKLMLLLYSKYLIVIIKKPVINPLYHHFKATFKFWLDRGFDAIYLDHISPLFESSDITLDEPVSLRVAKLVKQGALKKEAVSILI